VQLALAGLNVPVLFVVKDIVPMGATTDPGDRSVTVTLHEPGVLTLIDDVQVMPVVVARLLTRMLVVAPGFAAE
jgi:hypothetical protein